MRPFKRFKKNLRMDFLRWIFFATSLCFEAVFLFFNTENRDNLILFDVLILLVDFPYKNDKFYLKNIEKLGGEKLFLIP